MTDGVYSCMFLSTGSGVIVVDVPQTLAPNLLKGIASVTSEPITHVVYAHHHADHIGGAGVVPKGATFIAQQETAALVQHHDARGLNPLRAGKVVRSEDAPHCPARPRPARTRSCATTASTSACATSWVTFRSAIVNEATPREVRGHRIGVSTRTGAVTEDATIFEAHRATLLSLAYRMLGDFARAEDVVQDAWLRWQGRDAVVDAPKAFLVTVVTRLCLNELQSARARREESRSDRLPEPIDLKETGLESVEAIDDVSMAFLVVLQRLTPAERAVLLLHDVFDFSHAEIAALVNKSEPACRQILRRARENVAAERRGVAATREEHSRMVQAFVGAARAGDVEGLTRLLASDAVIVADGGAGGVTVGRVRNIPRPVEGAAKIAAFLASASKRDGGLDTREHVINGQPALIATQNGRTIAALLLVVRDGKIRSVFIHADPARLGHLAPS